MTPLVDVRHLVKEFHRPGFFGRGPAVRAVDDVTFTISAGETLGLVGESGSGKTTTGRCLLRLIEPTSGEVHLQGQNFLALSSKELRAARRYAQIVFQDPYSSLNPRMRVGDIVAEPLVIHRLGSRAERDARTRELLALVGMDPSVVRQYPREFSGGQRQRIGLARALALNPAFLVADEPVSALDVSVQAQVINLFIDLRERLGLTLLFIAHDLRVVRHLCDRVAVMYRGRIVEIARTSALFDEPVHTYTRALLSAIPRLTPGQRLERIPFDTTTYRPLALREVAPDHFAAIE